MGAPRNAERAAIRCHGIICGIARREEGGGIVGYPRAACGAVEERRFSAALRRAKLTGFSPCEPFAARPSLKDPTGKHLQNNAQPACILRKACPSTSIF
jgi:hypothetical protein